VIAAPLESTDAASPATLEIDYPDRELDRVTTLFRPITVGVLRCLRVSAYALLLTTDRYPPFRLSG
jgi:hypothetical protein